MKKQTTKPLGRTVPTFASGAEEADWWYKNRSAHGKQLLADRSLRTITQKREASAADSSRGGNK